MESPRVSAFTLPRRLKLCSKDKMMLFGRRTINIEQLRRKSLKNQSHLIWGNTCDHHFLIFFMPSKAPLLSWYWNSCGLKDHNMWTGADDCQTFLSAWTILHLCYAVSTSNLQLWTITLKQCKHIFKSNLIYCLSMALLCAPLVVLVWAARGWSLTLRVQTTWMSVSWPLPK